MRKPWVILWGITLLGALLRLLILSQRGSLWFDEAFSAHFAAMDLRTMWSFFKFENNPPLYFMLLHFWMKLFGNSELAVRILSMIFGIAAIPLIYVLGKKLHSTTAGLFAAFLLAISTFQVFYATETRMYALYLFLALLTVWLFLRNQELGIKDRELGIRNYELGVKLFRSVIHYSLFIILALLVWTHITAWLIVLALLLYLLWQSRSNLKQFFIIHSSFFISTALAALSLLPWLWTFFRLKIAAPLSQGWFFYIPPPRNFFLDMLEGFLVFGENNAFVVTVLSVMMVGLLVFALQRPLTPTVKFLLCWLFIPLLIGFAFQNAVPRYFIAVAPALYLLLGIGFAKLNNRELGIRNQELGVGRIFNSLIHNSLFIILISALVLPDYISLAKISNHQWDKLAGWIGNEECRMENVECKELVLVNPHSEVLPFERYYRGNLKVAGFYPREDNWDRDMRIVRTNWVSLVDQKNIRALAEITASYNRVFLITGETDPDAPRNLVPAWFWEQGWRKVADQDFGRIAVLMLVRP